MANGAERSASGKDIERYSLGERQAFLVSMKVFIVDSDGRLLVLKLQPDPGRPWSEKWILPGGLVNWGESLGDAAVREVKEEANLDILPSRTFSSSDMYIPLDPGFEFEDGRVVEARIAQIGILCTRLGGEVELGPEHTEYMFADKGQLEQFIEQHAFSPSTEPLVKDFILYYQG